MCVSNLIGEELGCRHLIGSVVWVYMPGLFQNCHFKIKCWTGHLLCIQLKNGFYFAK